MFTLRRNDIAYFTGVRMNDRVQLDVGGRSYLTRVENVLDKEVQVATPLDADWPQVGAVKERVVANVLTESGFRRFSTRITGFHQSRIPVVSLSHVRELSAVDRRRYRRVPVQIPLEYRLKNDEDSEPWFRGSTGDLSGSGLRMVSTDLAGIKINDYVDLRIQLPDSDIPMKAVGVLQWMSTSPDNAGKKTFGVSLALISHADRSHILRFAKTCKTLMMRLRRKSQRATSDLPVSYRVISADNTNEWHSATASDMSLTGLRLADNCADAREVGSRVAVEVMLPGNERPVSLTGTVEWTADGSCAKGEPSAGVHIDIISESDRGRIFDYVRNKLESFQ
jgi:c-di-GMP-binding flagellar brake protein YcgR